MTGKIRNNNQKTIIISTSPVGSPTSTGGNISDSSSSKEQDRFLPIANVSRIMKRALPANAKISKEAKETVQECVSEFISFITGEASDKCQREKRKTINGDDLLWAMTTLGFENYVGPLKVYLNNYRETEGDNNSNNNNKITTNNNTTAHQDQDHTDNIHDEINKFGVNSGFYYSSQVALTGFRDNSIAQNVATRNDADANLRYRVEW